MNRIALVRWRNSIAALCVVVLMGCGEKLPNHKPVTGSVSFQGKPLAAAHVRFIPIETTTGVGGHAKTDAEGKYRVVYAQGGNGLPPGKYKITVSQMLMPDGSPGPENVSPIESPAREMLPQHYSQELASRLTKEVPPDGGVLDLVLE
jgi:hypothetical protein